MPTLKSERQELFAQARAQGLSLTASARAAGYADGTCHIRGSEMGRNPKIQARVDELRSRLDDRLVEAVTADRHSILKGIGELVAEARAAKDRATAMRGLELLGRSVGLFNERAPEARSPLDGMSALELKALIEKIESVEDQVVASLASPMLQLVAGDDETAA